MVKYIVYMALLLVGSGVKACENNLSEHTDAISSNGHKVIPTLQLKNLCEKGPYAQMCVTPSPRTVVYITSLLENDILYPTLNDKNHSILLMDLNHKDLIIEGLKSNSMIMTKNFLQLTDFSLAEYSIKNGSKHYNFYQYTLKSPPRKGG